MARHGREEGTSAEGMGTCGGGEAMQGTMHWQWRGSACVVRGAGASAMVALRLEWRMHDHGGASEACECMGEA